MKWLKNQLRAAFNAAEAKKKAATPKPPRLAVSVGCPSGVGPEVAVAAAAQSRARVMLVGDLGALRAAARARGIEPKRLVRVDDPAAAFSGARDDALVVFEPTSPLGAADRAPGRPSRAGGAAQLAWIDAAADLVTAGIADALVTGPVSKDAIARSGAKSARAFRGHTEHLARRLASPEVTMAFWTDRLTTSLVTTHLALADVARAITPGEVARAIYWTARFISELGSTGHLAVAALNPHAGEGGLLGTEERRAIAPGIARARKRLAQGGVNVPIVGPVPAETAFRLAATGTYAGVVAMYHDQATIPMKLLGFGEAVNVSLGLPIVRTSVDHGTAYDRAGKGTADPRGMIEALSLAQALSRAGGGRP
ncbi:MAG: 4-hydroxythreonine-4-phosphate dehydrogenase PdxA [Labilithrix sp.]|nr:4-hydroxythreonine-4-phosphate dehydrogenase PdxA [Labilithrix sp.]MBX3223291.1 4-hydroxythreonine-4-phosphate dehydrogenase PdxA [Labilithrix sp.]